MNKYYKILIVILLVCCVSCNTKQNVSFSRALIKNISEEDKNYPSPFFNLIFFCKYQTEEVLSLNVYELREIYLGEYSHVDYSAFLSDLLNQRIAIQCMNESKRFKIDERVRANYKKMNINEFLDFFCIKKTDKIFWLKSDITEEQRNTVLYFLFTNNYIASDNDYSGTFSIIKME